MSAALPLHAAHSVPKSSARLIKPAEICLALVIEDCLFLKEKGDKLNVLFFKELIPPDKDFRDIKLLGTSYWYVGRREETVKLWTHLRKTRKWNPLSPDLVTAAYEPARRAWEDLVPGGMDLDFDRYVEDLTWLLFEPGKKG